MSAISQAVKAVGGPIAAARICGVRRQAVDKWIAKGSLPRTDYSGETAYASLLADHSLGGFTAAWLLSESAPKRAA
ncbi:hypothetical protein D3C76_1573640 [compost metagenome]